MNPATNSLFPPPQSSSSPPPPSSSSRSLCLRPQCTAYIGKMQRSTLGMCYILRCASDAIQMSSRPCTEYLGGILEIHSAVGRENEGQSHLSRILRWELEYLPCRSTIKNLLKRTFIYHHLLQFTKVGADSEMRRTPHPPHTHIQKLNAGVDVTQCCTNTPKFLTAPYRQTDFSYKNGANALWEGAVQMGLD